MSSYNESDHARGSDGRWALMSSGETDVAVLDGCSFADELSEEPLKRLDSAGLVMLIQTQTAGWSSDDRRRVARAMADATYLHRNQLRENRGSLPKTTYIEHPLRNAARMLRAGTPNAHMVSAALLHDTVEDCADQISASEGYDPNSLDKHAQRRVALRWMRRQHGPAVARIVERLSNPIMPPGSTREQKVASYMAHNEVADADPESAANKWMDFYDNAGSLHHNAPSKGRWLRADKYLCTGPC